MKIEDITGKTIERVEACGHPQVGYTLYFTDGTMAYIWASFDHLHTAWASNKEP